MLEEEVYYKLIGEKICHFRERVNMTQDELSKLMGLSRVSIVNFEKGRQRPSIYALYSLSNIFKITIAELLPDEILFNEDLNIISKNEQLSDDDYNQIIDFIKSTNIK